MTLEDQPADARSVASGSDDLDVSKGADNLLPPRLAAERRAVGGELSQHLLHSKREGHE